MQEKLKSRKYFKSSSQHSDEDLADILIELEPRGNLSDNVQVSELNLQTDGSNEFVNQGLDQANCSKLSENQKCELESQVGDFMTETSRLKSFCFKIIFNLSCKVLEKGLDFVPIQKN